MNRYVGFLIFVAALAVIIAAGWLAFRIPVPT
jgi:hypothetical protein